MKTQYKIPANKFYPPNLDGSMILFRKSLVVNVLATNRNLKRVVIISCQAGQGKTTLAQQFLENTSAEYAWYLAGQEDHDPVLMFAALLECLMRALPQFKPESVLSIVNDGDLSVLNLASVVNLLISELNSVLADDFYIVFDDLHLLDGSPAVFLLEYLLAAPSTRLKFILIGRQPLQLNAGCLEPASAVIALGKADMALSVIEMMELVNQQMGLNLSWEKVIEIHALTEGWIMGAVMLAMALQKDGAKIDDINGLVTSSGLDSYLKNEIFAHLAPDMAKKMAKLSLLEEIEIPLAIEITGDEDIGVHMLTESECNNFLHALDSEMQVFRLHHLCRDFLREKSAELLTDEESVAVFKSAAKYYLDKDLLESALSYYCKASSFDDLEIVLEMRGMKLVAMNRSLTILSLFESVPAEKRQELAWLNLLAGIVSIEVTPANCLPLLQQALLLFQKNGNLRGELLAISQLIYLHWVATGAFNYGADMLPRAEEIYGKLAVTLNGYDRILVCSHISCGFSAFKGEMDKSKFYSTEAMNLAKQHGMKNFMAAIIFIQGYCSYFSDQFLLVHHDIEKAQALLVDPHVGLFNRTALMALQVDVLGMKGDFNNYLWQEAVLIEPVGQERIDQTVLGSFLPIWRASLAIARGDFAEALEEVLRGHVSGIAALNPHLRSVLLQWQAYALALLDRKDESLAMAEESLALRKATGGPFFVACNSLLVGATFLQMGVLDKASDLLRHAADLAGQIGNNYILTAATLQIAYLKSVSGAGDKNFDELRHGLQALKKSKQTYCWGLTPVVLQDLLGRAVRLKIEAAWARNIAAERLSAAVLDNGELIPLLQISILGSFSIGIHGEIVCKTEDLPPAQRQMLATIIAAPDQKISQEKVQLLFWPDSPPDKSRSKLDVLLSRLRKSLGGMIEPLDLKNYLSLKKGMICLEHCAIDAVAFVEQAKAGLHYAARQQSWQAGNHFYPAMQLWRGCFASDIFSQDLVHEYCYEMRMLLVKASVKWGEILAEMGRYSGAVEVVERAFLYEPDNGQLVKMLYSLHMTVSNTLQAQQVVDRYENILRMDDYDSDEINEMLQQVVKL